MGKKLLSILSALVFALFFAKGVEPVTVVVSLSPPYSPFLHEYTSSGINKLQVTLIVNDSRMVNYPARLQMIVERLNSGIVMRTSDYAAIPPLVLNGQSTEILQGADLTAYFMAQNNIFQGSLQAQYVQTGRIPDGQYRIGFRVVDAQRTEVALSTTTYSQYGWFVLNDPPQLNLPRHNSTERVNDPQSVKLEWFPKHLGSMNSAFAAKYKIELFAIRVPGMEPNQVAMSTLPDYTEITNQTRLFITNDKYVLEPGVKYAWRVKAYAEEGFTLFQNDGYSEVFSFKYGSSCPTPQNVKSNVLTPEQAAISWDKDPLQTSYLVRYRAAWGLNAPWHNSESYVDKYTISNTLMPEHKYEYQVMAYCNKVQSEYSTIATFTTPASPMDKYVCGNADVVSVTNNVPKPILGVGEIIYNGKFPVKITEVSGSNGVFTGKGRMRIPFLNNIQVNMQFTRLRVNELNQVTGGEMVSVYNPDSKFLVDVALPSKNDNEQTGNTPTAANSNTETGNTSNTIILTSVVDTIIKTPEGDILIITENGDTTKIEKNDDGTVVVISDGDTAKVAAGQPVTVADANGNTTVVDSNGNITSSGNVAQKDNAKNPATVKFSATVNQSYGFDEYNPALQLADKYEMELINGKTYRIPWKSIKKGNADNVLLYVRPEKAKSAKPYVKITDENGTTLPLQSVSGDSVKQVQITALPYEGSKVITAGYAGSDTSKQLTTGGKLKVVSYTEISGDVAIVPVNGNKLSAKGITKEEIAIALKEAYKQACVTFTVSEISSVTYNYTSFDANPPNEMSYTADMLELINLVKAKSDYSSSKYYLFLLDKCTETNKSGLMPFNQQFGFIFVDRQSSEELKRTISHELGHGAFGLLHTFKTYGHQPQITERTTDNLMDYGTGTHLFKFQWDLIHSPMCYTETCGGGTDAASIRLSNIYYNDKPIGDNQTLFFVPEISKTIHLSAKAENKDGHFEDLIVNWSYGNTTIKNKEVNIALKAGSFDENNRITLQVKENVLLGKDVILNYYLEKLDIDVKKKIDDLLKYIKGLDDEFNKLTNEDLPNILKDKTEIESILLTEDKKYISKNMSDYLNDPGDGAFDDLETILIKMYRIDLEIKKYPNFDELIKEITNIYKDNSTFDDFYNEVIKTMLVFDPIGEKDKLKEKYINEIDSKTKETLYKRLKK